MERFKKTISIDAGRSRSYLLDEVDITIECKSKIEFSQEFMTELTHLVMDKLIICGKVMKDGELRKINMKDMKGGYPTGSIIE